MNKIFTFTLCLCAGIMVMSCEDDDLTTIDYPELSEGAFSPLRDFELNPAADGIIVLNSLEPGAEVEVTWASANSGLNEVITYSWLGYTDEPGIADPELIIEADDEGQSTSLTLTHQTINDALAELGLGDGEEITLNWTVRATSLEETLDAEPLTVSFRTFEEQLAPFSLVTPSSPGILGLDIDDPGSVVLVEWDSSSSTLGNDVSYRWIATDWEGDLSNPLISLEADDMGSLNQVSITHQALDDFLAGQGLPEGGIAILDWAVVASTDDLELQSTEVHTIVLRRFSRMEFFLVGGSTGADWNPPTSIPFLETGEGTYEVYTYITVNGDGFKILQNQEDFEGDWGMGAAGELVQEGETNLAVTEDAFYRVSLDFNDLTYTVEKMEWAIIGSATPNGWNDPDTDMMHSGVRGDNTWTIDVTLVDGAMKFRANDSWDLNFGDDGQDGTLEQNGADIAVVAGTYTITLTFDSVNGYTYSLE